MALSALRYMDEMPHMYETLSKRVNFYFDSYLIALHLTKNRKEQDPTCDYLSFTRFSRFSRQIAEH